MSSGEQPSPLKSKKISASSSQTRNDSENPWLVIPNNLELGARAKLSKKRNKEKLFQQENLSSPSEAAASLSFKPKPSFHSLPQVKSNTATWVKDQEKKCKQRAYESEEDYSDPDYYHHHQQNVHIPVAKLFPDEENQTHSLPCGGENENIKLMHDKFKKKEDYSDPDYYHHQQNVHFPANQPFSAHENHAHSLRCGVENENIKSGQDKFKKKEDYSDSDYYHHQQNVHFPANQTFPDQESQAHSLRCGSENDNIKSVQEKFKKKEDYSDPDYYHHHQQNIHFPANQPFPDQENQAHSLRCGSENDNNRSVQDKFKKKETAMAYEILNHIQAFLSEAESSCRKLDLSDEPIIKDAFVKLKNAVKNVETGRENKLMHQSVTENDYGSAVSPSSSISKISNSKENIVHRNVSKNALLCNDDEKQDKCNHHHLVKMSEPKTDSISSDEFIAIEDVGERVAAVEWERRKLKNKLLELQEENKIKDDLLRDLYSGPQAQVSASGDTHHQKTKEKKKRKLSKLQPVSQNIKQPTGVPFEDSPNVILESDTPTLPVLPRHSRPSASVKRDNVRKEQNSSFPARRHYEAEGRANEESDIPVGVGLTPPLSPTLDNDEVQENIRKLSKLPSVSQNIKQPTGVPFEDGPNVVLDSDAPVLASHRQEESEEIVADNLETAVEKKENLTKLHIQFLELMHIFETSHRKNDDPIRSSGEGAYTLKKIPTRNVVSEHTQKKQTIRTVPHQDNLQLTRQNIATMESQSQNSNLHNRDCNSVKKDNINNLSGKMGKLSIQNSMNSSYPDVLAASNNNMDSTSIFSYELNQSHSVPNEVERKNIFDILKRDKKKQKQYDRNQDNKACCNSSIDSEQFEGSNSALAFDSTTLGAWGGSSTQENFDDDNEEHGESLEEQDDEEENLSVFEKVSPRTQPTTQYSNMQQYVHSATNIANKKQRNFHHPSYTRNRNQLGVQSGFQQHSAQEVKTDRQRLASTSTGTGPLRDIRDNVTCSNDATEHCQQLPTKFIQRLLSHVDQLNALCQNQIYHERPQASTNSHLSQGCGHVPNTCASLQSVEVPFSYNQQLLLCLSQCYHALYMQQLELRHLQRSMWQDVEEENTHHQNYFNGRNGVEDEIFRPYFTPSCPNPFIPCSHYFTEQVSPVPSAPHFHLPMKHYTNHNTGTYSSSGTQPARAVIHPTSQNNASSQETLNNQVPPRTRANNFWDNFRSYSRQNLLSTSNTGKRNENVASPVTPQVRQVYPLVTNASINRSADTTNTYIPSSCSDSNRASLNPEDTTAKNIKFNTFTAGPSKKDIPTNISYSSSRSLRLRSHRANTEPNLLPPSSNESSNSIHHHQAILTENYRAGNVPPDALSTVSCQEVAGAIRASPEITNMLPNDHKSDFLIGLLHEAQVLKSETLRQKAIKMIQDLAMSEQHDNDENSQYKLQNDSAHSLAELENAACISDQHCSKTTAENASLLPDAGDNEKSGQLLSENTSTLPTAAIMPLSKHGTPKTVSTGAVRKKTKVVSGTPTEFLSSGSPSFGMHSSSSTSTNDNAILPTALPPNKTVEHIPGFISVKVVADLSSVLPSFKRKLLRDGCTQTFWTFINDHLLDSLRNHFLFYNINLSRKSLLDLRQTVYLFLSLFSGMTLANLDAVFLKYVGEFVYENISCYLASGHFAPVPSFLDEENCLMGVDDKNFELCVKMPSDSTEPVSIKMPVSSHEDVTEPLTIKMQDEAIGDLTIKDLPVSSDENNFSPRCAPIQLQNVLNIENLIPEALPFESKHVEAIRCDCNPEAEIEPEVEIGTEADLAEADQSPGQQNAGVIEAVPENWSLDHEMILHRNSGAILLLNGDETSDIGDSIEDAAGIQISSDVCLDEEAILDDIPTKLCASEEELPQQLKEEQSVQLSSDDALSQGEFVADNSEDIH